MIKGFEPPLELSPACGSRFQPKIALLAGLIAGGILLVVPSASPWERMSFFSPVIMGRPIPANVEMPLLLVWCLHLLLSLFYGFIIARVVARQRRGRAFVAGGLTGLILYLANFGVVTAVWHPVRGDEIPVVFTHIVFGLIAAGAYRGLLRREPIPTRRPEV